MSRHSNLKHLIDTYYPVCFVPCGMCELHISGKPSTFAGGCFYKVCLKSVGMDLDGRIVSSCLHVTPKEFLNIFEEMLSACSNKVGAACDGVSCEECAFHKLITLIGIGCNNVSVAKWVKKNLVNWHED